MAAVEKNEDLKSGLRLLVPISALSDEKFAELAAGTHIEEVKSGDKLFDEGDKDGRAVYVLAGKVAMMSGKSVVDTVVGGTEHARYPLAHHIPRQLSAVAKNAVSYVRIDNHLLDNLLSSGGQEATYEVSDVLEEEDEDWMSQMLQSEAFASLPAQNIQGMFMRMEEVVVKADETIVTQGERGEYFYMLRRGRCKVVIEKNNQSRVIAELGAGDSFGEEALIADTPRGATVTMLTDGVVMRLSREDFDNLMKQPLINWVTFDEGTEIVKDGGVWLDVRAPNEYKQSAIPASHNFPLSILRSNAERLKKSRKYVVYCDSGKRSSVAAFLLTQRGFEAYVLAGGYTAERFAAADTEAVVERKADATVVDITTRQTTVQADAADKSAAQEAAERHAASESERRAQVEAELAQLKAKQENASRLAEEETQKRLRAEEAVAQMQIEQDLARQKAEEEIQKRKEVEEEAARIKHEAQAAREKAEAEATKLRAERETAREKAETELNALREQREQAEKQAAEQAARLKEEAEAAHMIAAEAAARLKEEAAAARQAAEDDAQRIRAEASAAKEKAEAETARLQTEQVAAREKAEAEALRFRAEAERVRAEAEEEARVRSEEIASRIVAEAEAARFEVEQQVARLLAEAEGEKLRAQAEHASFLSSQEDARLKAEQDVARIRAEAEQARIKAAEEQHKMREVEAARLAAEEEAARLKAEAEASRRQIEEELNQRQAEAEATRYQAEEDAARIKAEAENARLRAEEEAARLSAELEAARMDVENENADAVARLEAEAEAARLEAREALRLKEEAETARLAAEQAALKVQEEATQIRLQAENEATRVMSDAETSRLKAEADAQRVKQQAEKAREQAEAEASRLANEVESAREQAERDARRLQSEAEDAQKRADAMIDKMRAEAESLKQRASEDEQQSSAAKPVSTDSTPPLEQLTIDEIAPIEDGEDEAEIIVLGEAGEEDDFVVVPSAFVDEQDDIERLISEAAEDTESVFVSQFTEQVVEPQLASEEKSQRTRLYAGIGAAAVIIVAASGWWLTRGDETSSTVATQVAPQTPVPAPVVDAPVVAAPPPTQVTASKAAVEPEAKPAPVVAHKPVYVRDSLKSGGQGPSMAVIPAGSFRMGSPSSSTEFDERPQHEVRLRGFAMSRYEVSVADFRRYVRATGKSAAAVQGRKDNEPVTKVNWLEAVRYAKWLSAQTGRQYRLPTEAEWEYAASAGVTSRFPWGDKIGKNQANCFNCGSQWDGAGPAAVGSFKANLFGLHDMTGNVSEWVQDCANRNYTGAPVDGSAWQSGDCRQRMVRGGAFNSPADSLRLKKRSQYAIDSNLNTIGIRLVRE
ncbi:SUMF1/EgtB/PvdO family nonheme iron enzyme [Sulfuriflexus sp.]|uniref:SUMF1/EgtB/PvdO family nonheme iron enzyme n=1 Tax=Sulfuriflexus sp. TaxID=2015443 RepID=UPI0028CE4020|nr:SUMF1/EgtB/PvdO family nonheme iron enzyme [Sulfuriflexus sp.]MDT8404554.1 SUMF1/EgtB/PvdO family nonheme iron enzyme [Sulfuriflexus sp.]